MKDRVSTGSKLQLEYTPENVWGKGGPGQPNMLLGKKFFNEGLIRHCTEFRLQSAEHLELKGVLGDYNKLQLEKDPLASLYGRLEENDKPKQKGFDPRPDTVKAFIDDLINELRVH